MNKDEYEQVCSICHRSSDIAGPMLEIIPGMCVCNDCMQKSIDTISRMQADGTLPPIDQYDMAACNQMFGNMPTPPEMSNEKAAEPVSAVPETPGSNATPAEADANGNDDKKDNQDKPPVKTMFLNINDLMGGGMFGGNERTRIKKKRVPKDGEELPPIIDFKKMPAPHKLKAMLDEYVVGQDKAKKLISVAVYNHYKRVATNTMDEIEIEKSNILMLGPTGCGKTYLVKTLAKILEVPLAITDATSLTEAGYIGDDIESVVSKLLAAADNDVERAECGIIFIDEIDKLAKKPDSKQRDVNGEAVQQGMLKLLEGAEIEVPVGASSKNAMVPMTTINTRNILFICGGAFPDLEEIIKSRLTKQSTIGFNGELKDKWDKEKNILSKVEVEDLKKFGLIPEFIGRLPIISPMDGLTKEAYVRILKEPKNAILKQYQKLLELDEVELVFTDDALEAIAEKAIKKDTGARALRAIIEEFMMDIMYEIPKDDNIGRVTINGDFINGIGGPVVDMRGN